MRATPTRATYHLGVRSAPRLDIYPLLSMGPVFASSTVDLDGGATRFRGQNTTLGIGLGAGFSYTVYGPLFVGAEARIRYAAGSYEYRLINGREKSFDRLALSCYALGLSKITLAVIKLSSRCVSNYSEDELFECK